MPRNEGRHCHCRQQSLTHSESIHNRTDDEQTEKDCVISPVDGLTPVESGALGKQNGLRGSSGWPARSSKSTRETSNYRGLKLREEDVFCYLFQWRNSLFVSEEANG